MSLIPSGLKNGTALSLGQMSVREQAPPEIMEFEAMDIFGEDEDAGADTRPRRLLKSGKWLVTNPDGSAEIVEEVRTQATGEDFDENLAEKLGETYLDTLSGMLLDQIEEDIASRSDWQDARTRAIDLLGLKLEQQGNNDSQGGTISKVYHPLLMESIVRYQANAGAELYPAIGPVKVYDADTDSTVERSEMAENMEKDFNFYLTSVDKSYYPDGDRMLFRQGLDGIAFKKVYTCPMRNRPVSDFVSADNLIVSDKSMDLETCGRVTERIWMRQNVMKRMQILGMYRKIVLGTPEENPTEIEAKIAETDGIQPVVNHVNPIDNRHELYETYVELDLEGYEQESGLPLPYRVTIDRTSRKILEIRRNWKEADPDYMPHIPYVDYPLIPGLGFYAYGFAHLVGNSTRALTAIIRMLIDAGMFACFPGFLRAKFGAAKANTNIRIMPGGSQEIDTGGRPIKDAIMDLPYKEPSGVLAELAQGLNTMGRELVGSANVPVGEGVQNTPVGTVLAMIEQSTKVQGAIHKRNHASQQRELEKMRDLFAENPSALIRYTKNPGQRWQTGQEFRDVRLVPASDPNVPSHLHRLMMAVAVAQRSDSNPGLYNKVEVEKYILKTIGISNPDSLLAPPPAPGSGPAPKSPDEIKQETEVIKSKAREGEQLREQAQDMQNHKNKMEQIAAEAAVKQMDNKASEVTARMKSADEMMKMAAKEIDASSRETVAAIKAREAREKAKAAKKSPKKKGE